MEKLNLTLSAGTMAASLLFGSVVFTLSVAVGTAIESLNYRVLRRATDRLFAGELQGSGAWSAVFALRFFFLGAAMYVAISAGAHPVGLVIGLSMMVPASVIVAWYQRPATLPETATCLEAEDPAWESWNPWLAQEQDADEDDA
jgi:hypothetical protein